MNTNKNQAEKVSGLLEVEDTRALNVMLVDIRRAGTELRFSGSVLEHALRATNDARKIVGQLALLLDGKQMEIVERLHGEILEFANAINHATGRMPKLDTIEQELRATFACPLQSIEITERITSPLGDAVRTHEHGRNQQKPVAVVAAA